MSIAFAELSRKNVCLWIIFQNHADWPRSILAVSFMAKRGNRTIVQRPKMRRRPLCPDGLDGLHDVMIAAQTACNTLRKRLRSGRKRLRSGRFLYGADQETGMVATIS